MAVVESAADRAAFLDPDDFGVEATFGGEPVNGIFDNEYVALLDGEAGVPVESRQPRFLCAAADVSGVAIGGAITIAGTAYTIRNVQPDGTGMVSLLLEED